MKSDTIPCFAVWSLSIDTYGGNHITFIGQERPGSVEGLRDSPGHAQQQLCKISFKVPGIKLGNSSYAGT